MSDESFTAIDYKGDTGHRCVSMEALFREFGVKFEVLWKSKDFDQITLRREPAASMMDEYGIIYTAFYDDNDVKHSFCSYLIDNLNSLLFHLEQSYGGIEVEDLPTDMFNKINDMFNDSLE